MSKQTTDIYDCFVDFTRAAKQCAHWANMIELIDAKQPIFRLPMLIDTDSDDIFCADFIVQDIDGTFCLTKITVGIEGVDASIEIGPVSLNFKTLQGDVDRWMFLSNWLYTRMADELNKPEMVNFEIKVAYD